MHKIFRLAESVLYGIFASIVERPTKKRGDYILDPCPPYISQFADRNRVDEFLNDPSTLVNDKYQSNFGFKDVSEYAFWAPRICAVACLAMCIEAYSPGKVKNLASLTREGVKLGGYIARDDKGQLVDKGWFYAPLVRLARRYGLKGRAVSGLTTNRIARSVCSGSTVPIVSVHPGVIRSDMNSVPKGGSRGGHLVVVIGVRFTDGLVNGFYIHNSSGRTIDKQERCFVSIERFNQAFANRGILLRLSIK